MYKLEHLQPKQANGLPLYPVRLVPDLYIHLKDSYLQDWSKAHNVFVHRAGAFLYFNSEADATLFILGHSHETA